MTDAESQAFLATLEPGRHITIAKWAADGAEVTRYPATVVASAAPAPWVELEARWTIGEVDVAGLRFVPGDTLREFFSPLHPFNAFAVYAPDGHLRGWYGNVTSSAFVTWEAGQPVLVWRDLYLDAVLVPNQDAALLDDDELEESGLPDTDPDFARAIVEAREVLLATIPSFPVLTTRFPARDSQP